MNTTIEQLTLPTPLGEEVLDMTEFATNESVVNGLASVKEKVDEESQAIQSAIQNIDLSSVESKVDEVKQAVENIDLSPVESKVEEGVNTLSSKIDNIKLPEIDTTELAKQGENAEATNSAIYDAVKAIPELKNMYAAHFEPNDEGEDTYTMVLPLAAVVDGDTLII